MNKLLRKYGNPPLFYQFLRKMKLTILIVTVSILSCLSAETYSQTTKLTITENNSTLLNVLRAIEGQSEFKFFYNEKVDVNRSVSVEATQKSVTDILDKVLLGTSVRYKVLGRQIALYDNNEMEPFMSEQQGKKVTGKVTDQSGASLPGVTILVKGTTTGTITDNNGQFRLTVLPDAKTLVFSFVGMKSQEIQIEGKTTFSVVLTEVTEAMEEVVVVGYGIQKKVTLTGAVSAIKNEDIVTVKNENIQNMLTGKIAGVRVVQNTSEPGSFSNQFDIRGLGSPLVIIDGIPRDNMTRLDPNDIESISILKDASAAIYGVRAANGVVLISTKKGADKTLELSYSGNMGWQITSGLPKSTGPIDWMTLANEAKMHNANGYQIRFTEADFAPYRDGTKQGTDWYSECIKEMAPETQHTLSATGGNETTHYYMSLGYMFQESFLRSNDFNYEKYNIRSNISSKLTNRLTLDLNIVGIMDETQKSTQDTYWIIESFWRSNPLHPVYANNTPPYLQQGLVDGTNPVSMMEKDVEGYRLWNKKWFQSSASLNYEVPYIKGLRAKTIFSFDYNIADNKMYKRGYYQYDYDAAAKKYIPMVRNFPSTLQRQHYTNQSILYQVSLNYDRIFAASHNVNGLLLFEGSQRNGDNFYASRELSIPIDQLLAGNSSLQQGYMDVGNLYKDANLGLVGKFGYNYKSKSLGEFNFRYDGSSKFGSGQQWGFFPVGSIGWRLSEESFWKDSKLSFINNFKARASYGKMGDDNASSYQFVAGYVYPAAGNGYALPGGNIFDDVFVNSSVNKGIINPYITWYEAKTFDLGLDMEAWSGLLGVTFDYFNRDRIGLLTTRSLSLPSVVGAALPQENLNGDYTQGIDLELNHRNRVGDFSYNVKGVFSYTRTKKTYVERSKDGNSYDNWKSNGNDRFNGIWWGYESNERYQDGRYQSYEDIANSPIYVGRGALPGDYAYEDWNGDGLISSLDSHPIAYNGVPMINFGLTLGAEYKGLDVNILLQGAAITNVSYLMQELTPMWGNDNSSALIKFMDRWHPVDPTTDPYDPNTKWVSGHFAYTGTLPDVNSEHNIQNGSYLRLKNIELGYTLPTRWTLKGGIKNVRLYVNGYNLLTLTRLKYVDAEHPSDRAYAYPLNKILAFGINVKF